MSIKILKSYKIFSFFIEDAEYIQVNTELQSGLLNVQFFPTYKSDCLKKP